ncbi:sigma-54 dependent DNA-binding response regulator [Enterococcus moraviensis ATCC BAA-383]|uniref:DNA translocase FtsK n=1 Tax=Enterococcus moraviensis ATCC BAA-383 TaxID=1158609 RepID=R2TDY3_9ENTE|nr:sigma 54-interacting transcriptional regulator [Enterococcus moraviensis]EOH98414.1 sigma-54 dependent DNA-binding response regulator [Enterococcus moraviensis ATCC BAA-383]EOT71723.1 sigma-54 dependent DNA-binding response regulator [Enterococcus moraviensis ATCC BAA-383]OJG67842.1 sigma-54 dependent DNA-binding response regulator [Enterococcus moraviensis]
MLKEKLLEYLKNQTSFFNPKNVSDIFSASDIADKFAIKRNTASHYLNQLADEGVLVKVNTRPVYFFHKKTFELQNYSLTNSFYHNLMEIEKEKPIFDKKIDFFQNVIGNHGSLAQTIEQLKMAALYPKGGLPLLLTGESGTGKSFLVQLLHQFCLANDLLTSDAPFITVNCAQYADNPELLTSHLFGHVTGAFTGADTDKMGAFEAAADGFLFLDEVHRLSAEGQEKLFTFLDQGIIYRMGESNNPIAVNCRLAFATTEEVGSTFLTTFLRRIPVQIKIPALNERTQAERKQLIIRSFFEEQQTILKTLVVSPQVINILENRSYKGNVGELKNLIKIITAKSFTANQDKPQIPITLHSLPNYLLAENQDSTLSEAETFLRIDGQNSLDYLLEESEPEQKRIIQSYEKILLTYVNKESDINTSVGLISREIDYLFDYLLFETKREQKHDMLLFITQHVRQMLEKIESAYQISFNGSLVYAVSHYLFQRRYVEWLPEVEMVQLIETLLLDVKAKLPNSYRYAEQILSLVKTSLDIEVSSMDRIILSVYIDNLGYTKETAYPKAVIVAHGYATASSIANVANRMLNELLFQSFDMPLDVTPKKIAEKMMQYIERNDTSNGLIILFDMGSLKEIHRYFSKETAAPIILMNNVTTSLAIAVGEGIQRKQQLSEIPEKAINAHHYQWEIIKPQTKKEKIIITTCATGIGTAVQISNLLEKSLPNDSIVKMVPCEFRQLRDPVEFEKAFSLYDVLGIVGTANPVVENIPFISLEDLIAGIGIESLLEWLKNVLVLNSQEEFSNQLIRNFSLDRVIQSVTILDTEKIIVQIEGFMKQLEERLGQRITNDRKLALYVHVSCLVERLIRNVPIEVYSGFDTLKECHKKELKHIKETFSVIEKVYSVNIPGSELSYVHDVLFENTEYVSDESDF